MAIITLTTDFGVDSPYVAQMKGVILSIAADATIVDITHAIAPQDVFAGALVLAEAAPWFPPETIHVAVVDPGVGTSRSIVAVRTDRHWLLAPDNGLLTGVLQSAASRDIFAVENRALCLPEISSTFHGRDIFAPVAAHLSRGIAGETLGRRVDAVQSVDWPTPRISADEIVGQIIAVDSFGNLITSITLRDLQQWPAWANVDIHCADEIIHGITQTYGLHQNGQIVALFGSSGRLELAVVGGNAAQQIKATRGAAVRLQQSPCKSPKHGE